jgi:diguanylate cyclase (GGDEF)-like protein
MVAHGVSTSPHRRRESRESWINNRLTNDIYYDGVTAEACMVDDFAAVPIAPVGGGIGQRRTGGDATRRRPWAGVPTTRSVVDVASVLGMSVVELPPAVQEAITALIEEVEHLREEADQVRRHESFLIGEADRHPVLPVLNRRAFLRQLARLIDMSERAQMPGSLLYLHVGGIERLRVVHGLAASDAALVAIADTIRADLRQTDLVGYLDGGDFAVALAVTEGEGAEDKAHRIVVRLSKQAFVWHDARFLFTLGQGLVHFRPGSSAEQTLAEADARRRGVEA